MLTRLAPLLARALSPSPPPGASAGVTLSLVRHWGGFKLGGTKKEESEEERCLREHEERCEKVREKAKKDEKRGKKEAGHGRDEGNVREMTAKEEKKYQKALAKQQKKERKATEKVDKLAKEREKKAREVTLKKEAGSKEKPKKEKQKKKSKKEEDKNVIESVCPPEECPPPEEQEGSRRSSSSSVLMGGGGDAVPLKSAKVAITGGDTLAALVLASLLKTNKHVGQIRIHGRDPALTGKAMDLSHIGSPTAVNSYVGPNELKLALQKADVVVVQGGLDQPCPELDVDLFESNAGYIQEVATACVTSCPEAMFAVMVQPVNSTLPLFAEVLKQNGVFCPNRVVGMVTEPYICAKLLVAKLLGVNPRSVWLPMTGGATVSTVVPIISGTKPGGVFLLNEIDNVVQAMRECPKKMRNINKGCLPSFSTAHAASTFINALVKGMCGQKTESLPALIRSDLIPDLDYMVLPVELGLTGITSSRGVPPMAPEEHALMEASIPQVIEDIQAAKAYAEQNVSNVAQASPHVPRFYAQAS